LCEEFREQEVVEVVKEVLGREGYRVVYEGRRGGPDVVACRDGEMLVIEVRGVPTPRKVKGKDKGRPKSVSTIKNQFRVWSAMVLWHLLAREHQLVKESEEWVAIAKNGCRKYGVVRFVGVLGYHEGYVGILEERALGLRRLGYEFWLLSKDGNVIKKFP